MWSGSTQNRDRINQIVFLQTVTGHWYTAGSEQITSTDGEISILNKHMTEGKKEREGAGEQYHRRHTERQREKWVVKDGVGVRCTYIMQEKTNTYRDLHILQKVLKEEFTCSYTCVIHFSQKN